MRSLAPEPVASRPRPAERAFVAVVLLLHAVFAIRGAWATSVTYDESFHVPAGVAYVTSGTTSISPVNPPLAKALFGLAALAVGARPPTPEVLAAPEARSASESFMRENREHYRSIFAAARLVSVALSVLLGWLVWSMTRARFGSGAAALAVVLWAWSPESLAHAGVATLEVPTTLLWLASVVVASRAVRSGTWRDVFGLAGIAAAFALTRFTAALVLPLVAGLWLLARLRGEAAPAGRAARLLIVPFAMLMALWLGYGDVFSRPLREGSFASERFRALQRQHPGARLPLPDALLVGLDRQSADAEPGHLTTYLLGQTGTKAVWWYFPFAIAIKWPLGLLAAMIAAAAAFVRRPRRAPLDLLYASAMFLVPAMFFGNLDAGVRYVLPLLPLACVVCAGALWPEYAPRASRFAAAALAVAVVVESAAAAPWWLSHFNPLAGPPERRERLLNDSNVDWGQGLAALAQELRARGIHKVHLTYHGTTDPALYGIDFEPYLTGRPGPESDWLAVSSYFYVGLPQAVRLRDGASPGIMVMDFHALPPEKAAARPGDCMWLFKVH